MGGFGLGFLGGKGGGKRSSAVPYAGSWLYIKTFKAKDRIFVHLSRFIFRDADMIESSVILWKTSFSFIMEKSISIWKISQKICSEKLQQVLFWKNSIKFCSEKIHKSFVLKKFTKVLLLNFFSFRMQEYLFHLSGRRQDICNEKLLFQDTNKNLWLNKSSFVGCRQDFCAERRASGRGWITSTAVAEKWPL